MFSTDRIKAKTDELVGLVKELTGLGGPEARRAAALAVTNYQQGAMWAVRAITSEDALVGDDGGAKGADRSEAMLAPEHDGETDP
jgi:hypothetical protein